MQRLISIGIRSYCTQRDVCRKMGQMYLSLVEEYFPIEGTHNLRIALMNSTPSKVFLLILPIFLNIVFSLVFNYRTDWCSSMVLFSFFYLDFLSQTFTIHRTAGKGEGIYLTPQLYHFHLLHRHLGISRYRVYYIL